MTFVRNLALAGSLVVGGGLAGVGAVASFAAGPVVTTPGSNLSSDIHAGETGEHATVNDVDTAQEADVDNGAVSDVAEEQNQVGEQETGTAGDKADAAGDQADPAGDSHATKGTDGTSGDSATPGAQGSDTP